MISFTNDIYKQITPRMSDIKFTRSMFDSYA